MVPKGAKGGFIDKARVTNGVKGDAGQSELLLGRNSKFKIVDILQQMDEENNQYHIDINLCLKCCKKKERRKRRLQI